MITSTNSKISSNSIPRDSLEPRAWPRLNSKNKVKEKSDFPSYLTLNSDGAGRETKTGKAPRRSLWTKIAAKTKKSNDTLQPTGTLNAKFEPLGNKGEDKTSAGP